MLMVEVNTLKIPVKTDSLKVGYKDSQRPSGTLVAWVPTALRDALLPALAQVRRERGRLSDQSSAASPVPTACEAEAVLHAGGETRACLTYSRRRRRSRERR